MLPAHRARLLAIAHPLAKPDETQNSLGVAAVCGPKEMGGNGQVARVCRNGCLRIVIEF